LKKRYIKDYVSNETGQLQYCGKYYVSQMSEEESKKEGRIQILYSIGCLVLLLAALCIPCKGNQTIYVVIPMEITLICFWIQLMGSLQLLKAGQRMEEKDYDKTYQSPIQALTIAIILYVFSLGGQIIGILMNGSQRSNGDIYFTMILLFVLVASCVVWNRRRKLMHYVTEEKIKNK